MQDYSLQINFMLLYFLIFSEIYSISQIYLPLSQDLN